MLKKLLPWQKSCLSAWEANQFRGIVNVITGAGKTMLAIAAIERLIQNADTRLNVKIVVPKTFLMYQWHTVLREELNIPRESIGFYSGAFKSLPNKMIMVYVINSARDVLARHIVENIGQGETVFLIADECHHYGSDSNARIFSYSSYIPADASVYTLGLSATPWCKNYHEVLVPALGDEIYRFGFLDALNADIISKFSLFNISVSFSHEERHTYDELSGQLSYALFQLLEIYPNLRSKKSRSFFTALEDVISGPNGEASDLAKSVLFLTTQRKEVVHQAKYRIDCVIELIRRIPKSAKIIIFGERIETAEEINRRLHIMYPNEAGLYHSKTPKDLGVHTLRQFKDGDIRILVSCKTLDEGLNVTEADVGIVVSSTGSRRQRIQRLGRVLRKKQNGHKACFYYLFVGDTTEEEEQLNDTAKPEFDRLINRINLQFNEKEGTFGNPQYMAWEMSIVENMTENGSTSDEIIEFMRNSDKGILTTDWLMPEQLCKHRIATAANKEERNYYIAMLLIIRKRVNFHTHE